MYKVCTAALMLHMQYLMTKYGMEQVIFIALNPMKTIFFIFCTNMTKRFELRKKNGFNCRSMDPHSENWQTRLPQKGAKELALPHHATRTRTSRFFALIKIQCERYSLQFFIKQNAQSVAAATVFWWNQACRILYLYCIMSPLLLRYIVVISYCSATRYSMCVRCAADTVLATACTPTCFICVYFYYV